MIIIAFVVAIMVIGLLGLAATRPDTLSIQRVTEIKAPPERIFALINDFHHWPRWAPQDRMDATMQRTFSGPADGLGARSDWVSQGQAGSGSMEVIESTAPRQITVRVRFIKPFAALNTNQFTLEPMPEMTRVIWTMHGTNPYIAKVLSLFLNMDRMLGKHFEAGLQSLKELAET